MKRLADRLAGCAGPGRELLLRQRKRYAHTSLGGLAEARTQLHEPLGNASDRVERAELDPFGVRFAQAQAQHLEKKESHAGVCPEKFAKILAAQYQRVHWVQRDCGRATGEAVEYGHLTQEIARSANGKENLAALCGVIRDLNPTLRYEGDAIGAIVLGEDGPAARKLPSRPSLLERARFVIRQLRQERRVLYVSRFPHLLQPCQGVCRLQGPSEEGPSMPDLV